MLTYRDFFNCVKDRGFLPFLILLFLTPKIVYNVKHTFHDTLNKVTGTDQQRFSGEVAKKLGCES